MRVIDLSQEISPDMQVFPAYPRPAVVPWTRFGIYPFESEAIFFVTHTGTHVDAPCHFIPNAKRIHEVPPNALIGDGILLDLSHKGPKQHITDDDLRGAEEKSGVSVREGDIVLIRTGWDRYLGKPEYLTYYPGLSKNAVDYLEARRVSAVGVDSPNLDHPEDSTFPAHITFLSKGILVVENLYNLGEIRKPRFKFIALPLRIRGGTGSPIRAIAIED